MAQAGGDISVHSELGLGTTFAIRSPVQPVEAPTRAAMPSLPPDVSGAGAAAILVADNESSIGTLLGRVLNRCGYQTEAVAEMLAR